MNWWQIGLSGAMGSGLVTLLVFLLASSQRASALAGEAMKSMRGSISMQEKFRQAMWQQSRALDEWEDWGRQMTRAWNQLIILLEKGLDTTGAELPKMPAPPANHPDLSKIFDDDT
jgi:hypothetical protein